MSKKVGLIAYLVLLTFACESENGKNFSTTDRSTSEHNEPPRNPLEPIESLQVVYIGASNCNHCSSDEAIEKITFIKNRLNEVADHLGYQTWFTGIAADEDPVSGYEHLKETWPYHEINTGAYYYNWGHMEYIWGEGDFAGQGSVPQILINRSTYRIEPAGMGIGNAFREEQLVKRYSGSQDLALLYEKLMEDDFEKIATQLGINSLAD
ncbi:hypothetical protein DYD21_19815 [Rhodohalobacter sp. SW132]|uniref:hypothetical protein n=1 Tax=Rhodohalobacter sp. SW132 TaxID=2293433 RepID=UPI000E26A4FC|nr:hypothetical protein [Rhodohalobacter sp. SW132]REL24059.1 hypothetical protein DYD21_19815 [Rhodohalobacter sp. SW132]